MIVTCDVCPQFNFYNPGGHGKSFACVDGTLAVVSVKSSLDSSELRDALDNLASIPQHTFNPEWPGSETAHYDQWPYKIIYASTGVQAKTATDALQEYYQVHQSIPMNRRPDVIHVAGKYCIRRSYHDIPYGEHTIHAGQFYTMTVDCDVSTLALVIDRIQQTLMASRQIPYYFGDVVYQMFDMEAGDSENP